MAATSRSTDRQPEERARLRAWTRAGIPSRFWSFRLRTSPLAETHPELIQRLTFPAVPGEADGESAWERWAALQADWARSWYFHGPCGVGKTGLAVSYAWEYLDPRAPGGDPAYAQPVLFTSTPDLLGELRESYGAGGAGEGPLLRKYTEAPLLILDDIGSEFLRGTGWAEGQLFRIINLRHREERTTVFTSNLSLQALVERLGERVGWRVVEACGPGHIVRVQGPNLRDFLEANDEAGRA